MYYFDNAATTKPCEQAVQAVVNGLTKDFGNPSSLYKLGLDAENIVEAARKEIANAIGCDNSQSIYFTSCATEGSNTVVFGCAKNYGRRKNKVVTTGVEHPSVENSFSELEKQGFEIVRVFPDDSGNISAEQIFSEVDENTFLVSCMLVNNETGYILPVADAFKKIKKKYPECITHCDAVQGFLKIDFKVKQLYADCISLSGHKIYAPKGIGALYIKKGVRIAPYLIGGGQEKGFRSGTESVPLISGFGEAVKFFSLTTQKRLEHAKSLKDYLKTKIAECKGLELNSDDDCSPYINSVSVNRIKSEVLLHYLEKREIYVSSGSACAKGKKSSVLKAFKIPERNLDSTIRISFSHETTKEDIDVLIENIIKAQDELCKLK